MGRGWPGYGRCLASVTRWQGTTTAQLGKSPGKTISRCAIVRAGADGVLATPTADLPGRVGKAEAAANEGGAGTPQ